MNIRMVKQLEINNLEDLDKISILFADILSPNIAVHFEGNLGAGKTTLIKAILAASGLSDNVTSPTFSLIESYIHNDINYHHIDLYRIQSPSELEYTGILELDKGNSIFFIEWASMASEVLPQSDIDIVINQKNDTRMISIAANTDQGINVVKKLP